MNAEAKTTHYSHPATRRQAGAVHKSLLGALLLLSLSAVAQAGTIDVSTSYVRDGTLKASCSVPGTTGTAIDCYYLVDSADASDYAFTGDDGEALSAFDSGGASQLIAEAGFYNTVDNSLSAHTGQVEQVTNTSGSAQQYRYTFSLFDIMLRLSDYAGASNTTPGAPVAAWGIDILLNGATIWESSASLVGGRHGHILNTMGTALGYSYVDENPSFPDRVFGYDFNPYTSTLDLGILDPGDSLTLEFLKDTSISAAGFELGGLAKIGDPYTLSGGHSGQITSSQVSGVPEPATLALLAGGLALLRLSRRTKHT